MHLDDDDFELNLLKEETEIHAVNVFGNPHWKLEADGVLNLEREYILCAAIWVDDKKIRRSQPKNVKDGIVVCGHRHYNCFATLKEMFYENWQQCGSGECNRKRIEVLNDETQGFLTNTNRFVGRNEAANIARHAGQIGWNSKRNWNLTELYSEDLY